LRPTDGIKNPSVNSQEPIMKTTHIVTVPTILSIISMILGSPSFGQDAPDRVNGNLIQFNDNGAWCWYQDERGGVGNRNAGKAGDFGGNPSLDLECQSNAVGSLLLPSDRGESFEDFKDGVDQIA
jgi:hypothetical protein